ncbi:hypothetical protein H7169_03875, partial [Candidatus Gracilibacteria bacterium]|nr:hypothetical protein [Candidatus Gracilibacteria bacterium]
MYKSAPLIALTLILSLLFSGAYAVTYPTATPSGETTGGVYNTYFTNMYNPSGCTIGQVLRGFTSTGVLLCTSGATGWSLLGNSGTTAGTNFMGTTDNIDVVFKRNNIEAMRLSGVSGNIGIGISAPTEKLDVAGAIKLTSGNPTDTIYANNTSGLVLESQGNTYGTVRMTLQNINGSNGALFEIPGAGSPQLIDFGFKTVSGGQRNIRFETRGGSTFANGGTPEFQFGSSADPTLVVNDSTTYIRKGNVGIGIANPGAMLEVAGQVKITGGTPGANKVLTSDATGLASWQTVTATSVSATGVVGGVEAYLTKFGIGGNGLYPSLLYETGANIGIGTTTPGAKLEVKGTVKISGLITTPGLAKLEVEGQVRIIGGTPGVDKVLTSDATGLASWTSKNQICPGSGPNNTCYGSGALVSSTSGNGNVAIG